MRIKLSEKYQNEREDICKKLISIIELDENKSFLLCDLDNDIAKQNKIIEMKDDIQKYFACSTISSFKPNFECKRPYLNIIRSILRQQNYVFERSEIEKSNGVFRTRDKNSAISIMKLTKEWIETQTRPSEFCFQHPPTPCIASVKAGNEIRQS